jgi:type VI protein secretion system component VasK
MAEDKEPRINISQSANNSTNVTQIGHSTGNITINNKATIPSATDDDQQKLERLLTELQQALKTVEADHPDDAKDVADMANELVKTAQAEKPNPAMLQIRAEGLKQAAQTLKDVAPTVLAIATQVVAHILKLGS